ncbi:hypothetical protein BST61_g2366 [Cercospora zeina]
MDRSRAREYDSTASRGDSHDDSDIGFSIRGAAQRKLSQDSQVQPQPQSRPASPRSQYSHHTQSRSPPRRRDWPYRDRDEPESNRDSRSRYSSRNDDRYYSRHSSSSDYYQQGYSYSRQHYEPYQDHSDYGFYEEPVAPPPSNGDADVSLDGKPLQILLLRGFKANISEGVVSKGLEKLYQDESHAQQDATVPPPGLPSGAGGPLAAALATLPLKPLPLPGAMPGSLKRVFVIRDRETDKSLSYGFAEYHTVSDAMAALAKATTLGDKFTISSKKIDICYPHMGVFPLVIPGQFGTDATHSFQHSSGNPHYYHDKRYYASILDVNPQPPTGPVSPTQPDNTKDTKNTKTNKKRPKESAGISSLEDEITTKKAKTGEPKELGIVNLWQKKQAELRGEHTDKNETRPSTPSFEKHSTEDPPQQSYIVEKVEGGKPRYTCYLCTSRLPEGVTPEGHVTGSTKHSTTLQDEEKVKMAWKRLAKHGVEADQTVKVETKATEKKEPVKEPEEEPEKEKTAWRDRAEERRIQEAKAGTTEKVKVSLKDVKKKKQQGGDGSAQSQPTKPTYGKGMTMLQKAGWAEGEGLGAGGGITAPIEQMSYNAGVGLGHEGAKKGDANEEAERATRGGGDWVKKTKEVARERFERMQ